jgi:predicted SprT family Zn-dependent metalloprotease
MTTPIFQQISPSNNQVSATYLYTCATCRKQVAKTKRFHISNHDFCSVQHLVDWKLKNPSINSNETEPTIIQSGGWNNKF